MLTKYVVTDERTDGWTGGVKTTQLQLSGWKRLELNDWKCGPMVSSGGPMGPFIPIFKLELHFPSHAPLCIILV